MLILIWTNKKRNKMKRFIIALSFIVALGIGANAQEYQFVDSKSDGFFSSSQELLVCHPGAYCAPVVIITVDLHKTVSVHLNGHIRHAKRVGFTQKQNSQNAFHMTFSISTHAMGERFALAFNCTCRGRKYNFESVHFKFVLLLTLCTV